MVSKNVYIDKLDDIVNKWNNTYHSTIKMKPVDVKSNAYSNSVKKIKNIDSKFKIGDIVRISKYKNISAKGYTTYWSEEVFAIKKVKNAEPKAYAINDFTREEIIGIFNENKLQKSKSRRTYN